MSSRQNYLRVRGEYCGGSKFTRSKVELPPRARRILNDQIQQRTDKGTTSACAENTYGGPQGGFHPGNYLRVRGEYLLRKNQPDFEEELPPRARRIQTNAIMI